MAVARRQRNEVRTPLPAQYRPQLALLVKSAPEGDDWLHEIKFDGYRIGCFIDGSQVRLVSRNGNDWTARFPSIRDAATALPCKQALLDGEIAVVLPDGRTSFQALQNAFAAAPVNGEIVYFVFDVLHLDGDDLSRRPLEARKRLVAELLSDGHALIRYSDHVVGHGREFFEQACRLGTEGIVSKRRSASYQAGRGPTWVKTKCIKRQEFVIGGFTDPEGSRSGIGALLVGVQDASGLVFAGKVGTGFTRESANALRKQLDAIERRESPFASRPPTAISRRAHWVAPKLVAEVAFSEWTNDGRIRHPSFQGLRGDKPPRAIVREREADPPAARRARGDRITVAGISISHPERVVYPDVGVTKLDVARYYESIADWILPHLAGRPLTLVRCPEGIGTSCFYMKHAGAWMPGGSSVRKARIQEKTKVGEYFVADNVAALITMMQANVIELHTWNATVDRVDCPDRIVLDLDPGPAVAWKAIVEAARVVRLALQKIELESFVKTTGGRGLHVVVPLLPKDDWRAGLAVARAVADAIVRLNPKMYTTEFAKAGREAKILIDYKRNNRLNTSIAAYSTRARPGAPVSVPVTWEELGKLRGSNQFTVLNLGRRLKRLRADPWAHYWKCKQRLPANAAERLSRGGAEEGEWKLRSPLPHFSGRGLG